MKQKILNTFSDIISNLLYYDRKEDEELEVGDIERFLIKNPEFMKELVDNFELQLKESMENYL